ncbi:methyltransferase domain-containing protein [Gemella cuniculi]|uniref:methyltransferase domain-containing protein n=1 Tax=Gemella cuniculi TaxID=150240 RepID=UPI000413834C|nr:methyltransferase domain-containing protein [Gemella cuniculi]
MKQSNGKVRLSVETFYDNISKNKEKTKVDSKELSKSLGYEEEVINQFPEEINMGLSCGNPIHHLKIKEGQSLIDLGCGGGLDIFITKMKNPKVGTLYGLDRLDSMLEKARKVCDKKNFKNIEFIKGELIDIPLQEKTVDRVISNCVINLEPNKQKVYDEIYRILKDDGMFVISDIVLKKELPLEWKNSERMLCTCVAGAILEEEIVDIVKKAGFKKFQIINSEVTDEYSEKWGYGEEIKDYIQSGLLIGRK